jgi:hypothetical protein
MSHYWSLPLLLLLLLPDSKNIEPKRRLVAIVTPVTRPPSLILPPRRRVDPLQVDRDDYDSFKPDGRLWQPVKRLLPPQPLRLQLLQLLLLLLLLRLLLLQ